MRLYTDSGGGRFPFLYDDTAKKLGLKVVGLKKDDGVQVGSTTLPDSFEKQNIPLSQEWIGRTRVFTYDSKSGAEVNAIRFILGDGFFGATFFDGKVWKFNYPNGQLSRCTGLQTAGYSVVPMYFKTTNGKRDTSQPRVEMEVNGEKIPVLFDTGATSFYSDEAVMLIRPKRAFTASSFIRSSVAAKWRKAYPSWRTVKAGDKFGKMDLIEVPEIKFAGYSVGPLWLALRKDEIYDKYSEEIMDSRIDGAIGGNLFSSLEMIADYPGAKLYVRKVSK